MSDEKSIPPEPKPPRMRIYMIGVGWLCNKEVNKHGCNKRRYHSGACKDVLTFWEVIKRQLCL